MSVKSLLDTSHANSENNIMVNNLIADGNEEILNPIAYNYASVTQIGVITDTVNCDSVLGRIVTVNTTLAPNSSTQFIVNSDKIGANSYVMMSMENYSGVYITNGVPICNIGTVVFGGFVVHVTNIHPTNALNGVITLIFKVVDENV